MNLYWITMPLGIRVGVFSKTLTYVRNIQYIYGKTKGFFYQASINVWWIKLYILENINGGVFVMSWYGYLERNGG